MAVNRKIVLASRPSGAPVPENFRYEEGPMPELADGELLVRAMVNLVSNAIRYSPAGSAIEFKVNLNSGFVTCHIIDHGVGMDDAQIERLLASEDMPLNRVTENQPDAAQSMGVGFIMARTVIRRHGGTVALLSEVGLGTTVVVRLPVLA